MKWIKIKFGDPDESLFARIDKEREVRAWCYKHLPEGDWFFCSPGVMEFKHEKEAVLFALRWS